MMLMAVMMKATMTCAMDRFEKLEAVMLKLFLKRVAYPTELV